MKTTLQLLQDGKRLLTEKGWTQGATARDSGGDSVFSWDKRATCYCGQGAVRAAASPAGPVAAYSLAARRAENTLDDVVGEEFDWDFPNFNDAEGRTLDEVLAKFDEAIAAEEALIADRR